MIIWQQPNGTLAFTYVSDDIDEVQHANELKANSDFPQDWTLLATGQFTLPSWPIHEDLRFVNNEIVVDMTSAIFSTKKRLRKERDPLLKEQDIKFQRALEENSSTSDIIAEKQRLRDLTKLADTVTTLEELTNLKP